MITQFALCDGPQAYNNNNDSYVVTTDIKISIRKSEST